MYNIKLLNKIASCGTSLFDEKKYNVGEGVENPDAIMVRSAAMHDMEFGKELLAIARAGAGVNNIPIDKCSQEGIVVFNTPGANANAVKELAVAALLLASRKIVDGVNWAQTLKGNEDVAKAVEEIKAGKIEYRLDKSNIIHVPIGKASFEEAKLADNFHALMDAIIKAKPSSLKGQYLKSVTLTATMGPGVKLNVNKLVG